MLDDNSIEDWQKASAQFERFAKPIILLVSLFAIVPDLPLLKPLMKPFLGEPLIKAVRNVIAGAF